MSPEKQHEKTLFESAFDLTDRDARRSFLEHACGEDVALRTRLEKLLESQEPAEAFFTLNPARPPGADAFIGRYKLVQRLGEGGCGVVYLAEQQEPVRRPVALKIIRLGMDTENVIARFEMERQSLALMDHPNIARVLDAGATESGRPYFVMEVVQGVKITDYCDRHRLDVAHRLDLFIRVCQAIQHAHQKGVIHLDIKPSNILITLHDGMPVPKLIDFGIAKATGGHLADRTASAAGAPFIGTPVYMSPEQADADGTDIDTRGDIYSLGVLLGELLSGCAPFDTPPPEAGADVDELRRFIRERRALAPSAVFAALAPAEQERIAAERLLSPRRLASLLHGDLDCIVLKALQANRGRRYETANALAMDVRRCREHEPVEAHAPSRMYHFQKWVGRNRQVCFAGALVLGTLLAGLGTSTRLYYREREARHEQARLRAEAEKAQSNEAALRRQAEMREKIAQAAVQVNYNNIAGADALVAGIPLDLIPASLESAKVLRTLGRWHVEAGRWRMAAERFDGLARAITRVDATDTDDVSRDLLPAGASICEAGTPAAYEQFRRLAVARFALSAKPIPAEHTIKSCLLKPADDALLRQLAPLAQIAAATLQDADFKTGSDLHMAAWRSFALALFEYRTGRPAEAISWVRRCEAYRNDNPARLASSRLVFALSCHRLGRDTEARASLQQARQLIEAWFHAGVDVNSGSQQGFWFDWINARILLREASALIDHPAPASPPAH